MAISNELIKKLRDRTGAGMMDCKKALEETGGDMDRAVEHLRKKGAAVSQKRADRAAKEGMIVTRTAADGKSGVIVEVNSETDFVGRSDDFTSFAAMVAETVEKHRPASGEALLALTTPAGKTVGEMLNDLLAKVGEKVDVRRFAVVDAGDGFVSAYTHLGSKIGVLVELAGKGDPSVGRDVAMQIAAMSPQVVDRTQVAKETIDRELEIYRIQATNEGKPAQVVERIATGRLEKYFQETALLEQTFIRDATKTIKDVLAASGLTVKRFHRYHLGEDMK